MAIKDPSSAKSATGPASTSRRRLLKALAATAVAPVAAAAYHASPAEAAAPRIEFRIVRAGFIVGASSGSGTLRFDGKRYRLRIGGVSLGATFGAASAEFVGRVRNLRKPQDIAGNYTAMARALRPRAAAALPGCAIRAASNSRSRASRSASWPRST